MSQIVTPVVLVPRFTTVVGGGAFLSLPIDVSAYEEAEMSVWRSALIGTGSTITIDVEESTDRNTWETVPGWDGDPGSGTEDRYTLKMTKRWMRAAVSSVVAANEITMTATTVWLSW